MTRDRIARLRQQTCLQMARDIVAVQGSVQDIRDAMRDFYAECFSRDTEFHGLIHAWNERKIERELMGADLALTDEEIDYLLPKDGGRK